MYFFWETMTPEFLIVFPIELALEKSLVILYSGKINFEKHVFNWTDW